MTVSTSNETIFHADAEHQGLRAVVILTLLVGFVLFYLLVQFVFRALFHESPLILVCSSALPLALGFGWLLEKWLMRVWHSGRNITIHAAGIRAVNQVSTDTNLRWAANLMQLNWTFKLGGYPRGGRERRLPANHHCLAVQLQQAGQYLVVYAFMPAKKKQAILQQAQGNFVELNLEDVYKTTLRSRVFSPPTRPDIPSKVIAGANGRFWLAEKRRWQEGFELEPRDFELFLQLVEENSQ